MARAIDLYPPDHALALAHVLRVVGIIAARPEILDDEVVAQLVSEGVGQVDAKLLVLFVPRALSYPLLRRLGVTSFQNIYVVRTAAGRVVNMRFEAEHYFTAALAWAEGLFNLEEAARPISRDAYMAVAGRSAEIGCANQMLDRYGPAGCRGSVIGPQVLCEITAEQIAASRPQQSRKRPWWRFWG